MDKYTRETELRTFKMDTLDTDGPRFSIKENARLQPHFWYELARFSSLIDAIEYLDAVAQRSRDEADKIALGLLFNE